MWQEDLGKSQSPFQHVSPAEPLYENGGLLLRRPWAIIAARQDHIVDAIAQVDFPEG